jgi:uncharacterized protein DUF3501
MLPLTLDDLLPLEEYAGRRREFFDSHCRYLDRYRRVRLGPRLTLIFENRQTLWFRVQEIVRVARLTDSQNLQQELDLFNRLLPCKNHLQAALVLEVEEDARLADELPPWKNIPDHSLWFCLEEKRYPATLLTSRPEDRALGAAHWVEFSLDETARRLLADIGQPAFFHFQSPEYDHQSPHLSDDIRQSLLDDLALSDRDDVHAKAG